MKKLKESLIRLVYPEVCFKCNKTLTVEERCLCEECFTRFRAKLYGLSKCDIDIDDKNIRYLWSLASYNGIIKDILIAFKFKKRADLLTPFKPSIEELYSAIATELTHDLIIAVPSSLFNRISRFYCSSEEISEFIGKKFKIESGNDFIRKRLGVPSQRHLRKEERLANLYGAFKISHSKQIKDKSVLLIDDIYTTGTTLREVARVLIKSGARTVDSLTLAETTESKPEKKF